MMESEDAWESPRPNNQLLEWRTIEVKLSTHELEALVKIADEYQLSKEVVARALIRRSLIPEGI